jgi:hypothetical protein
MRHSDTGFRLNVNANRDEMLAFAKTEFPPATEGDLKA